MRKIIAYSVILLLSASCGIQQFDVPSLCGTFHGAITGQKGTLSISVLLELNADKTCFYSESIDLSQNQCRGEWVMLNDGEIEIICNNNPQVCDILRGLLGGRFIEGTFKIRVINTIVR